MKNYTGLWWRHGVVTCSHCGRFHGGLTHVKQPKLWTVQLNNGVWGTIYSWITVNLRWRSNMNKRQGGTQWRRSAWTVPSQIVPGSGTFEETQPVKPYDQRRLFIWIYDTPQIEYSYEIHMNYSNIRYVDGWSFNGILSLKEMCPVHARCEIWA